MSDPKMKSYYYNFHDAVKLKIVKKEEKFLEKFFSHLDMEYDYFKSKPFEGYDIKLTIGDFESKADGSFVVDGKYHVKKDYIYFADSYKFAKWEVEISGFENYPSTAIEINVKSNLFGYLFFDGYILEFILKYALLKKGYCMIHAAATSRKQATIYPARSGIGKTTTALQNVFKGCDFLGDDHVILKDGFVYAFPSFIHVFSYHLSHNIYEENLTLTQKANIKLKYLIYKATGGFAKFFSYFTIKDIFPKVNVVNKSKIGRFVMLRTLGGSERRITKDEMVGSLFWNVFIESYPFNHYLEAYSYIFPSSSFASFWSDYKKNLNKQIREDCYVVE